MYIFSINTQQINQIVFKSYLKSEKVLNTDLRKSNHSGCE